MDAKKAKTAPQSRMSETQVVALGKLADFTKFTPNKEVGLHYKTREAFVQQGFAATDASGSKIKITSAGRKAYDKARQQAGN